MKSMASNGSPSGYGRDIAERLGLGPEVRELKLGPTFTGDRGTAFHTLKYDFKPASVDVSKMATVEVGSNHMMTVTVPHLDGAGIPHTVFKGSQRPYSKECVLIIDRITGEITLEKLSSNIQVKKTRVEPKSQLLAVPTSNSTNSSGRPHTPVETKRSPTHGRSTSRTKVSTGKKREPTVQLHPKTQQPSPKGISPYHGKSPPNVNSNSSPAQSMGPSTHPSLPMIGADFEDFPAPAQPPKATSPPSKPSPNFDTGTTTVISRDQVGVLSESSSSSSSSSSSDSDSDEETHRPMTANGHANGHTSSPNPILMNMPDNLLNDDLQLSESESDSD
ncbi:ell-associated factor Eaf [Diachasma alloeum]|uniref:ell-associated factor Eaf n=1 Tax=Diachasma alloeum TaxID=454923 RepID=UPI00073826B8|nr:ell-associated factor Eaf [Diachasma alloeum]